MALLQLSFYLALVQAAASVCGNLFEYCSTYPTPPWRYSKVANSSNGSLYVSELALAKSHLPDKSVADLVEEPKRFGLGLARTSERDVFVEEFISPHLERILTFSELPEELANLPELLVNSPLVSLAVQGSQLAVRSVHDEALIRQAHWPAIRAVIERATGEEWPHDFWHAHKRAAQKKVVVLRSDWEMAATPKELIVANRFWTRAKKQAEQLGLEIKLTMHMHSRPAGMREDEPTNFLLDRLLKPTAPDLFTADRMNVDWLEIRTLGTASQIYSSHTSTARYFDLREIHELREEFLSLWDELKTTNEVALKYLERNFADLALQAEFESLPIDQLAWYALGHFKYSRMHELLRVPSVEETLRGRILHQIFGP